MLATAKAILFSGPLIGVLGMLGGSLPALASDHNGQDHSYGGPVQTWCDVNPDCNGWNKGLRRSSYDRTSALATVPAPKPRPSRKLRPAASSR
jgi:hypothetical protein